LGICTKGPKGRLTQSPQRAQRRVKKRTVHECICALVHKRPFRWTLDVQPWTWFLLSVRETSCSCAKAPKTFLTQSRKARKGKPEQGIKPGFSLFLASFAVLVTEGNERETSGLLRQGPESHASRPLVTQAPVTRSRRKARKGKPERKGVNSGFSHFWRPLRLK